MQPLAARTSAIRVSAFLMGLSALMAAGFFGPDAWREAQAKANVRNLLKDPESARFQDMQVYPEHRSTCGVVNAKNSLGGYAGQRRFIVFHTGLSQLDDASPEFLSLWAASCS